MRLFCTLFFSSHSSFYTLDFGHQGVANPQYFGHWGVQLPGVWDTGELLEPTTCESWATINNCV